MIKFYMWIKYVVSITMYTKWEIFMIALHFMCILLTSMIISYCTFKYIQNDDLSLTDYKQFYDTQDDVFPELSLCFKNPFLNGKLEELYSINESLYLRFLQGDYFDKSLQKINYNDVTIALEDYITEYFIQWVNVTDSLFPAATHHDEMHRFVSASTSGFWSTLGFFKCFAVMHPPNREIQSFALVIQDQIFQNRGRNDYQFLAFLHYPNQKFLEPINVRYYWQERTGHSSYEMKFVVSGVEILRRREDGNQPCDKDWQHYDDKITEQFTDQVGCITPYQSVKNSNISICSDGLKMRAARFYLFGQPHHLPPPCKTLVKINYDYEEFELADSDWGRDGNFWITFRLHNHGFKEIVLSRYCLLICYFYAP